jgi:tRNA(adenine34) deaminase
MWSNIGKGFQVAFETAWSAFKSGSIPIGACILNEHNEVVAVGRNQTHAEGDGLISLHQLAHAEANAILKVSEVTTPNQHPNIRKYTLYTTMEPCPFCFGAIVMGSIRNVKFAARDRWAGAAALNTALDYFKRKNIVIEGPFADIEIVQIAIQTCFEMSIRDAKVLIDAWSEDCPKGVETGKRLFESGELFELARQAVEASVAFDYIAFGTAGDIMGVNIF